jgi:hypothetical protein
MLLKATRTLLGELTALDRLDRMNNPNQIGTTNVREERRREEKNSFTSLLTRNNTNKCNNWPQHATQENKWNEIGPELLLQSYKLTIQ